MPESVPVSEPLDPTKYRLGPLCKRGHDYQGTGQSLRRVGSAACVACDIEQQRERRQAKREAGTHEGRSMTPRRRLTSKAIKGVRGPLLHGTA